MGGPLRVLLLEPWYGGSHRQWADGYAAASSLEVAVVGLPATGWRWRLLGGAAPMAEAAQRVVQERGWKEGPDVVLASGLVDLAQVLGLSRRWLQGRVPLVVFQHESQMVHPAGVGRADHAATDHAATLADWASWLAADAVWFNSDYHRRAVVASVGSWLGSLPGPELSSTEDAVTGRFRVMGLGLELDWLTARRSTPRQSQSCGAGPLILWPHRWEPDKDPDAFGRALQRLERAGLDFGLVLAGEVPAVGDDRRAELARRFSDRVMACGPFDQDTYRYWLGRSDLVVSCAHHDFFGVAVAEAVAAGCTPVVPAGLAYEEVLDDPSVGYPPTRFGTALEQAVRNWAPVDLGPSRWATAVARYAWSIQAPRYDQALAELAD